VRAIPSFPVEDDSFFFPFSGPVWCFWKTFKRPMHVWPRGWPVVFPPLFPLVLNCLLPFLPEIQFFSRNTPFARVRHPAGIFVFISKSPVGPPQYRSPSLEMFLIKSFVPLCITPSAHRVTGPFFGRVADSILFYWLLLVDGGVFRIYFFLNPSFLFFYSRNVLFPHPHSNPTPWACQWTHPWSPPSTPGKSVQMIRKEFFERYTACQSADYLPTFISMVLTPTVGPIPPDCLPFFLLVKTTHYPTVRFF